MSSFKLSPGEEFPKIKVSLLDGSKITLGKDRKNLNWQLVVVYRGKHCPLCTRYLNLLEAHKKELEKISVGIIAVSSDSGEQLKEHLKMLDISYPIAYGLNEAEMKSLGLYISAPRSANETDHNFSEPALFIVNENGRIQALNISNAPFFRPEADVIVRGLTFIRNRDDYPIRGTVA